MKIAVVGKFLRSRVVRDNGEDRVEIRVTLPQEAGIVQDTPLILSKWEAQEVAMELLRNCFQIDNSGEAQAMGMSEAKREGR